MTDTEKTDSVTNAITTTHTAITRAVETRAVKISCSVKQLVDFACRTGNLESYGVAGPTAAEGQAAHKLLQAKKSKDEKAEVRVQSRITVDSHQLKVSGRIDLLNAEPDTLCASEIKSCYAPPEKLAETTVSLHWSQLKIYGYCVLDNLRTQLPNPPTTITLRLLWYNLMTKEVIVDEKCLGLHELEAFVTEAAKLYIKWIQLLESQFAQTVASASALEFPHQEFRAGQRDMASGVYLSARDGFHLMCEAPTGIGKTVSALFPAAKAIGNESIDRIIYLTAKNSGRQAAGNCLEMLYQQGLKLSAITITSKKTTCHCSNGTCERNAEDGSCPLTIGFYDRLPQARERLIQSGIITPDAIDSAAHEFALCPFELTLQMLPWVQVVICDFNYVFDPLVRLSDLADKTDRQLLLVDEAHNLPDRSRSMFSAKLDTLEIKKALDDLDKNSLQGKNLQALVRAIKRWSKECTETESAHDEPPKSITRAVKRCTQSLITGSEQSAGEQPAIMTEALAEVAKALFRYEVIQDLFGDHHRTITTKSKSGRYTNTTINLQCLNASDQLNKSFQKFRSSVSFSATLRPQQFFIDSLGLPEKSTTLTLNSPFAVEQQRTVICDWVDTRYQARAKSIAPIVDIIFDVFNARQGNYQVFFPSYAYMESVHDEFVQRHPAVPTSIQKRGSAEHERQSFLEQFRCGKPVLAFSILGGIYGEGIDYTGDQLIGSIIVGTGLSSINLVQSLIEKDYQSRGLNGFDYGSRYPGFTRVLQTAGRVIRTESDRGVVILIDSRYRHTFYQNLFPDHWRAAVCDNKSTLLESINTFWHPDQVAPG